jgi:hypothetical protein
MGDQENRTELLIYTSPDGKTRIDGRLQDETVWLSQAQLSELFQTTKQNISLHIKNVLEESELQGNSVVKEYLTTAPDGVRDFLRRGHPLFHQPMREPRPPSRRGRSTGSGAERLPG